MKNIFLVFFLIISSISIHAQQVAIPDVEQYKLSNGLKVYMIEYGNIPVTSITLYINCGKRNETPGQQYLSQLAASCVNFGNEKYDHTTLDNKFFKLGSTLAASARDNYTAISSTFVNNTIEEGVDVFANAVLHPMFPEKEIKQMISETIDYNNPSKIDITEQANIFSAFWVYGSSNPLGRYFYKDQLLKITPASIKEFYQFNYTPTNAQLVICGKLDKEKLKALIEKSFGTWAAPYGEVNGAAFESPVIKKKEAGFINRDKATQTALQWTKNGPEPKSKDVLAFLISNITFNDILMKEVRDKGGKTYGISSSYNYYSLSNLYTISTQVRNEEMLNTINLVDKVIESFYTNGITFKQMEDAKKQIRNRWLAIEQPGSVISFFNPLVYPKPESRKNYISEIDALTLADINKAIKKYYAPGVYKLMIAGANTALDNQLKQIPGLKIFNVKDIEVDQ